VPPQKQEIRNPETLSYLAGDRKIFLFEPITREVAKTFTALMIYYSNTSQEDVSIYINTNGGESDALANIYDIMQNVEFPISTYCIGKAYSAGAFILAAGTKGKRFITKNSTVMIHGLQAQFPHPLLLSHKDSDVYFKYLEQINNYIAGILARHTENPISKINKDLERDLYLSATEAVKYKIADHIL